MDRSRYPINHRNLAAEYQRRRLEEEKAVAVAPEVVTGNLGSWLRFSQSKSARALNQIKPDPLPSRARTRYVTQMRYGGRTPVTDAGPLFH
jgi:hypothetical protein